MFAPLLVGLALLGGSYRDRYPLPSGVVPDGWGVNIHFTAPRAGEMEAIRAAGFRWVRMDVTWSAVERRRGVYDFRAYDTLMGHLERVGLRSMFILCYGNDLYQKGAPTTPAAQRAFAKFAAAAVARYQGRGVVWELWNEPNSARFWPPRVDVDQYISLARIASAAIRRVGPDEWWVGPAVSGFDWAFLTRCFEAGLLSEWDAVTVHPYRLTPPETAGPDWARLRLLMGRYGPIKPMLSGEWGYSERYAGLNVRKQAQYAVRQYVANLAAGVPLSIWYDWRDDGQSPTEVEHHFGTVEFDGKPKPAYEAIRAMSRALEGRRFLRALPGNRFLFSGNPIWTVELRGEEPLARPATPQEAASLAIPWPDGPWMVGGTEEVQAVIERAAASLGKGPLTVDGGSWKLDLRESDAGAGADLAFHLGRGETATWLNVTAGQKPVWAGWSVSSRPLEVLLAPSAAEQQLRVRIRSLGEPISETLNVEVSIGTRVIRRRVAMRDGRGEAVFPWYPWEVRSGLSVVVSNDRDVPQLGLPSRRFVPIVLVDPAQRLALVDGDPKIPARASARTERSEDGGPDRDAVRLDYEAAEGWRFVVLSDRRPSPLPGTPVEMSAWVFGDASGHALRMRFVDASGQTFQPDYGPIDWVGWRQVRFSLRGDKAGYWGGAGDGVVHLPIRVTTPILVDLLKRAGSGSIQIAGIVVVTGPERETR